MGTRADFYVGKGESAEWIGSIGWDGYPDGIDEHVFKAESEAAYRQAVTAFFADREDVTLPADGWPWPWDTSHTTDYAYAYAFADGKVEASGFGSSWFNPTDEDAEERASDKGASFPDMSARKNVTLGPRSGVIVVSG